VDDTRGTRATHIQGPSIRRKILLSVATLIARGLLCSVPYLLAIETAWVIPLCVSGILSLWLALTGRFLAGFAVACLAGILYAFFLQAFEVRYLYRFSLKDGRMFQSGGYSAYRSLFREAEWTRLIAAAAGTTFLAALNIVTLFCRLHHDNAFQPGRARAA
jgi:hypothetical protein